jgi:hypothetical protein
MSLLFGERLDELVAEGKLVDDGECYTVPCHQVIFADDICREFFLPEHRTMMRAHIARDWGPSGPDNTAFP